MNKSEWTAGPDYIEGVAESLSSADMVSHGWDLSEWKPGLGRLERRAGKDGYTFRLYAGQGGPRGAADLAVQLEVILKEHKDRGRWGG